VGAVCVVIVGIGVAGFGKSARILQWRQNWVDHKQKLAPLGKPCRKSLQHKRFGKVSMAPSGLSIWRHWNGERTGEVAVYDLRGDNLKVQGA
jgi:hypothetical protein